MCSVVPSFQRKISFEEYECLHTSRAITSRLTSPTKPPASVNGCGCVSIAVMTKGALVFGALDNAPLNDYDNKVKLGSELAISFDQIRDHRKSSQF